VKHIREEMELFIPSILVLFVCFILLAFVMPRMSPFMLGVVCIVMFALGVWQHYSMFPYEYRTSMVTDMLQEFSGFIMLIAIIFSGLILMYIFNGNSATNLIPASIIPASIIPEMSTPALLSNNSKSIFNSGSTGVSGIINNASKTMSNASKTMTNLIKSANQTRSNNLVSPSFKVS